MLASDHGYVEIVKSLLAHQANINAQNEWGESVLLGAVLHNQSTVVSILLAHGANPNLTAKNGASPLLIATETEGIKLDIIRELIQAGSIVNDPSLDGVTPLMMACDRGNAKIVKLLLENGANVNVRDNNQWTPLKIAVHRGFMEIANLLQQAGAKE